MQRYFAKNIIDKKVELDSGDYHHIKNVMRCKNNDNIEVVFNNKLYIATILDIENFNIEVTEEKDDNNELPIELIVAVGLVKEQKMDLILQKLTELGVSRIIPIKFSRSIVNLDDKKIDKKIVRWTSICKEASEQSKRNIIPIIDRPITVKELTKIEADKKLVASVREDNNFISNYLQNNEKGVKILVVIGPEGGIADNEEDILNDNGFNSVSLGKSVLRVETAAIYVASVINYSCGV